MTDGEDAFRAASLEEIRRALAASSSRMATLPPLPRKVRLRLGLTSRVDDAAYWLVCHGHCTAAKRLWQLFRMW